MKSYKLKFDWREPDGTVTQRTITFTNDGRFTRNSVTDHVIPQNEEQFELGMQTYIKNENATVIND